MQTVIFLEFLQAACENMVRLCETILYWSTVVRLLLQQHSHSCTHLQASLMLIILQLLLKLCKPVV